MLGTNDLQARYGRSPRQIADAAVALARTVQASSGGIGTTFPAPKVLIVPPVQVGSMPVEDWARRYAGGRAKSAGFSAAFKKAAGAARVPEFDTAAAIGGAAHGVDGLHLSKADHRKLAEAILPTVQHATNAP